MKKKSIVLFLAVLLIFAFAMPVSAKTYGDLYYEIIDGKVAITDCNKFAEGYLAIPSSIEGYPVTSINKAAFSGCGYLTEIVIPNGVTNIGDGAFSTCHSLSKVIIPNTVTDIGWAAFYHCINLTSVKIPDGVTSIAQSTFSYCHSLTEVVFPNSVTVIGAGVFMDCDKLKEIVLPNGVISIGNSAFNGCSSLIIINIPNSVTDIGSDAFNNCKNLTSIVIPDSVKKIGINTFEGCDNLTIYGEQGSKAELYAKKEGIPFELIKESTSDPVLTVKFIDVKSDAYYATPVAWAVSKGVTSGTSATTFSPDNACTRGQAVTFLWRAAGKPAPKSPNNPFTDVKAGEYYYDAVLWAVENGITMGTSATTFSPDATCNRGQIVTFLYRAEGSPDVAVRNTFNDVESDAYYAKAVSWAVANGVTTGTSATTFSPDSDCTRGQIVTFLYRAEN